MIRCSWKHQANIGGLLLAFWMLALAAIVGQARGDDNDRVRVEAMTPEQVDALRRNKERFNQMAPAEQERIRNLHASLERHENSDRLKSLLTKYTSWLRNLPAGQRAELLSLPSRERLTKMREIIQRQEQERFRRLATDKLTNEDYHALMTWARNLALSRKDELIPAIPESFRAKFESASEKDRIGVLTFTLLRSPEKISVKQPEINVLLESLSDTAKATVLEAKSLDQQIVVVREWVKMAAFSRTRFGARPPVPEKDLTEFYNKLDERAKEYLNGLPSDRMKRELEAMYHNRSWMNRRRGMGGGRSGRGGFGGRRGAEEPGKRSSNSPDNAENANGKKKHSETQSTEPASKKSSSGS